MKVNLNESAPAVDRLATPDEIAAAILPFPNALEECYEDLLCEIAVDTGGFVRIRDLELEMSIIVEQLLRTDDSWTN
jgi:hypothetical protein